MNENSMLSGIAERLVSRPYEHEKFRSHLTSISLTLLLDLFQDVPWLQLNDEEKFGSLMGIMIKLENNIPSITGDDPSVVKHVYQTLREAINNRCDV